MKLQYQQSGLYAKRPVVALRELFYKNLESVNFPAQPTDMIRRHNVLIVHIEGAGRGGRTDVFRFPEPRDIGRRGCAGNR